jgi:hypothetical protein
MVEEQAVCLRRHRFLNCAIDPPEDLTQPGSTAARHVCCGSEDQVMRPRSGLKRPSSQLFECVDVEAWR